MIAEEAARVGATRVAATLHISIRTVEFHLSGVYRKLGVPRQRLSDALDRDLGDEP